MKARLNGADHEEFFRDWLRGLYVSRAISVIGLFISSAGLVSALFGGLWAVAFLHGFASAIWAWVLWKSFADADHVRALRDTMRAEVKRLEQELKGYKLFVETLDTISKEEDKK